MLYRLWNQQAGGVRAESVDPGRKICRAPAAALYRKGHGSREGGVPSNELIDRLEAD